LYSASSRIHTLNALFVTNQSRQPSAGQPPHAACRHRLAHRPARQPQSAVQRSPPSVTHIMCYYSFNRPQRDGRLSWPCWLTDSGCFTHKVVKEPSFSLAQDRESLPARTDILTTMLRHQLTLMCDPTWQVMLYSCDWLQLRAMNNV